MVSGLASLPVSLQAIDLSLTRACRSRPTGVAFNPGLNPLSVPIVQVSLFDSEGVDQHYRLGEVLQGLRDEGILIIGAGMAVHNLRDFRAMRGKTIKDMP